jgi:hypothetical protein
MDWNNVEDATDDLVLTVVATGDDPQPPGSFPVIRRGGPRDGLVMFWGRVPEGVRSPTRVLMADEEAFGEYDDE